MRATAARVRRSLALVKKSTANQHKVHNVEKYIQWVNAVASNTVDLHSFSCCCLYQICEIPRKSDKTRGCIRSRSSKVIDLDVNLKNISLCDFKDGKWLASSPFLVWRPSRGKPLEFLDETYPAKTRGIGLPYGENFIILTSTVFPWYTRVTDGRTIAYSALSIYAICCRALKNGRIAINYN